jgi:L-fuculose-phosphate aldolase
MNNKNTNDIKKQMCEIARLIWERRLTNAYGGNFAARAGKDSFLVTPSMMAEEKHCRLVPDDLLLVGFDGTVIEGAGRLSRETEMHGALLRAFPSVGAVIHAHPVNCMVFAAAEKPIPSMTEATERQGAAGLAKFAPMCTPEMCDNVLAYYEERRALTETMPVACVLPQHGVVVTGKDLNNAYAML